MSECAETDAARRLDAVASRMADDALRLLDSLSLGRYRAVLSACYHYTHSSGRQLDRAADLAPDEILRTFFAEMADEERHHYQLAQADLMSVGMTGPDPAPPAVAAFAAYWNAIDAGNFFEFIGATYVLETLADRLRSRAIAALSSLGLSPNQTRFILTHLDADDQHGREAAAMCERYLPVHGPDIIRGAEAAARYWHEGLEALLRS